MMGRLIDRAGYEAGKVMAASVQSFLGVKSFCAD
jgi:hypothetical protein